MILGLLLSLTGALAPLGVSHILFADISRIFEFLHENSNIRYFLVSGIRTINSTIEKNFMVFFIDKGVEKLKKIMMTLLLSVLVMAACSNSTGNNNSAENEADNNQVTNNNQEDNNDNAADNNNEENEVDEPENNTNDSDETDTAEPDKPETDNNADKDEENEQSENNEAVNDNSEDNSAEEADDQTEEDQLRELGFQILQAQNDEDYEYLESKLAKGASLDEGTNTFKFETHDMEFVQEDKDNLEYRFIHEDDNDVIIVGFAVVDYETESSYTIDFQFVEDSGEWKMKDMDKNA